MNSSGFGLLVRRPRNREFDFRVHPVHDPSGADINEECSRVVLDRIGELRRPWRSGLEVVLVEPDLEASLFRVGAREQPPPQLARCLRVGTGMAKEDEGRSLCHATSDDFVQTDTFKTHQQAVSTARHAGAPAIYFDGVQTWVPLF
jgi:hypothetical protein